MALLSEVGFATWYPLIRETLGSDPIIKCLGEYHNYIVHRGMLQPSSLAHLGVAEGKGLKIGFGMRVDPLEDNDSVMSGYLRMAKEHGDPFGLLADDGDSRPCVERHWALPAFGDLNLVDLWVDAWMNVAEVISGVFRWIGIELDHPNLDCRHGSKAVQIRVYLREELAQGILQGYAFPARENRRARLNVATGFDAESDLRTKGSSTRCECLYVVWQCCHGNEFLWD